MTHRFSTGSGDARESNDLHTFLDELAGGNPDPSIALDPSLAATIHYVHGVGDQSVAADIPRAGKARRWEDLMRTDARSLEPHVPAAIPFPARRLSSSSGSPRLAEPSRLRRWGGHSMGLVATLTLVMLVAAAGTGVYLTMPDGSDDTDQPATLAGVIQGTPTLVPVEREPGDPRLVFQHCATEPMPFDEVMAVLEQNAYVMYENDRVDTSRMELPLPDGIAPDAETRNQLDAILVQALSCRGYFVRHAALSTDAGIVRMFTDETSNGFGRLNGERLLQTWSERDMDVIVSNTERRLNSVALTEVRVLPDGRIAGYLTIDFEVQDDGTFTHEGYGYVVFAEQDGRWLVDDFRPETVG